VGGLASNISQRATTPTSAALRGRNRSDPSRAAFSNPLTAEPVVARIVGGDGALAYAGIVGVSFAGGGAGSVAADSVRCDRSAATDRDASASCVTSAAALSPAGSESVLAAKPVVSSGFCNGAGEADPPFREGGCSRSIDFLAFFFRPLVVLSKS